MRKEEIEYQIAEIEKTLEELKDDYTRVRKTDAELLKKNRMNRIQIHIGQHANQLNKLKEELSEIEG